MLYERAERAAPNHGKRFALANGRKPNRFREFAGGLGISGWSSPTDAMFENKASSLILRFKMEAYDAKPAWDGAADVLNYDSTNWR